MKPCMRPSVLSLALAGACFAQAVAAEPFIRRNALSNEAAADVAAMNTALAKMRALPCDNAASWYYQGAIHSVPNQVTDNKLCPSYQTRADLKPAWATCTHVKGSEIHFLIWHRLYILHFEKIVRELSGKADFALPYWYYTDSTQRTLPALFRDPAQAVFARERVQTMNAGGSIPSGMDGYLDLTALNQNTVFEVFSKNIDRAPHGAMHSYLGGSFDDTPMYNPIYQQDGMYGLMSQVPSAAFDPIFWLHHSNIDLLWQKWEAGPDGARPTLDQLKAVPWTYKFFDAKGNTIEYTVEEAYKAAFRIDYAYDQMLITTPEIDSVGHEQLTTRTQSHEKTLVWSRTDLSVPLTARSVTLEATRAEGDKAALKALKEDGALVLELEVSFVDEPRDSYMVYVVQDGKKSVAGPMTFFGATHHGAEPGMEGHDHAMSLNFAYDLSDEINPGEDYQLLIESQTGRGSAAKVTSMSLYRY